MLPPRFPRSDQPRQPVWKCLGAEGEQHTVGAPLSVPVGDKFPRSDTRFPIRSDRLFVFGCATQGETCMASKFNLDDLFKQMSEFSASCGASLQAPMPADPFGQSVRPRTRGCLDCGKMKFEENDQCLLVCVDCGVINGSMQVTATYEDEQQFRNQNDALAEELGYAEEPPLVQVVHTIPSGLPCSECKDVVQEYAIDLQKVATFFHDWAKDAFEDETRSYREVQTIVRQFHMYVVRMQRVNSNMNQIYRRTRADFFGKLQPYRALKILDPVFAQQQTKGKDAAALAKLLNAAELAISNRLRCPPGARAKLTSRLCLFYNKGGLEGVPECIAKVSKDEDRAEMRSLWDGRLRKELTPQTATVVQTSQERVVQVLMRVIGIEATAEFVKSMIAESSPANAHSKLLESMTKFGIPERFKPLLNVIYKFTDCNERYCCAGAACQGRMAIGFQVGRRKPFSHSAFVNEVSYSNNKDTLWKLSMPLLALLPSKLVKSQSQLAFFKSEFYRLRSLRTLGLLSAFREWNWFDLSASPDRLSVHTCTIVFGFYFQYMHNYVCALQNHSGEYEQSTFESMSDVLKTDYKRSHDENGNSLIDAVFITWSEAWRDSLRRGDDGAISDDDKPVPPKTMYEMRNVAEFDRKLRGRLLGANIDAKVFKGVKYLVEPTTKSMAEVVSSLWINSTPGSLGIDREVSYEVAALRQVQSRVLEDAHFSVPSASLVFLMNSASPILENSHFWNLHKLLCGAAGRFSQCGSHAFEVDVKLLPNLFIMVDDERRTFTLHESIASPVQVSQDPGDPGVAHLAVALGSEDSVFSRANTNKESGQENEFGSQDEAYIRYLRLLYGTRSDSGNLVGKAISLTDAERSALETSARCQALERTASLPNIVFDLTVAARVSAQDATDAIRELANSCATGRTSPAKRDSTGNVLACQVSAKISELRRKLSDELHDICAKLGDAEFVAAINLQIPNCSHRRIRTLISTHRDFVNASAVIPPHDKTKQVIQAIVTAVDTLEFLQTMEYKKYHGSYRSVVSFLDSQSYGLFKKINLVYYESYSVRYAQNLSNAKKRVVVSINEFKHTKPVFHRLDGDLLEKSRKEFEKCKEKEKYEKMETAFGIEGREGRDAFAQVGMTKAFLNEPEFMERYMVDAIQKFFSYTDEEFRAKVDEARNVAGTIMLHLNLFSLTRTSPDCISLECASDETIQVLTSKLGIFCVCAAAAFKGSNSQRMHADFLLKRGCDLYEVSSDLSAENRCGSASLLPFPGSEYQRTLSSDVGALIAHHSGRNKPPPYPTLTSEQAERLMASAAKPKRPHQLESTLQARRDEHIRQQQEAAVSGSGFVVFAAPPARKG